MPVMFGFENEYFLRNKDGNIARVVPYDLPQDAANILVEVRSEPAENPFQVLASFNAKHAELVEAAGKLGYTLVNLPEYHFQPENYIETAGFHIHFSGKPEWQARTVQALQPSIQPVVERLDKRFHKYFTGIRRHHEHVRVKPYGWEYRRLPATVDPVIVAAVLARDFA